MLTLSLIATNSPTTLGMAASLEDPKLVSRHVDLMAAMCEVESNCDSTKVGDAGEIGSYQILECYWEDAVEYDPSIGGKYEDVLDKDYAERIMIAYWDRYCNERRLGRKPTDEDRARIHNKGPNGYKKASSIKYWNKVKVVLMGE